MRLREFSIKGLFGLFDHEVPLNLGARITLIHAPNGYGKTVILKMIEAFFGGSLRIFREVKFDTVNFIFEDGTYIEIDQREPQIELPLQRRLERKLGYKISYFANGDVQTFSPDNIQRTDWDRLIPNLERELPLRRISSNVWHDLRFGDEISEPEIVERYEYIFRRSRRGEPRFPEWLERVRSVFSCRLIATQRLFSPAQKEEEKYGKPQDAMAPAVKAYSMELANSIQMLLANSAVLAQSLDQTFPNRLLVRMRSDSIPPTEDESRKQLIELGKRRERLAAVGLLDASDNVDLITHDRMEANTLRILAEYIEDTRNKLDFYDDMLAKLELMSEILNSRFQFKRVSFNKDTGFTLRNPSNVILAPESLSSGEQHELVMIFDLLFKAPKGSLILIDEPEISLHIAWQKRFLTDLKKIINLTEIDTILSTHSPQIIGSNFDLAVQLRAPRNDEHDDV